MPRYINLNFSVLNPGVKEQAEKLSVCGWGGGGKGGGECCFFLVIYCYVNPCIFCKFSQQHFC